MKLSTLSLEMPLLFFPLRVTYPRDHTFTHKTEKLRVSLEEISHSYRDVTKAGIISPLPVYIVVTSKL